MHALDDNVCHFTESTLYADAMTAHGVEVELQLYPKGGHGFGLGRPEDGTDNWVRLAAIWIKNLK